ncbi:unnamed protein product [Ilex paraguariensis]|uniref:Mediator of RNA polymerase II transcription subunit 1 n=1 Tax=Ilex paraguariensis TaxID=185542 RepID=A0ABC8TQG5_9AQUA
MERSEPALVPEWLRCPGSVIGGGTSSHHFAASSSHSGNDSLTRNRSSRSIGEKDSPRSGFLDRTSSSNFRRSSGSEGSTKHPYSSFTRSHHDKNREREKDRIVIGDLWNHDGLDPLGNILSSRVEKTTLQRSQSLLSRIPGEVLPRRAVDLKNGGHNHNCGHGVFSGDFIVSGMQKAAFEKDFPSLKTEEKHGVPDIGRVSSPGLSISVQSLSIGNSGFAGGERWTSALAEVPAIISGNGLGHSFVQQSVTSPMSGSASAMAGPNMAEALSQAPSQAHTLPQLPDKTQRLEELAIKQSRQLIPMTPSLPKALALNSSDKSKQPKTTVRTNEMNVAAKSVQQQQQQQPHSSQLANQSLRSRQVISDASKASHAGKFLVLKPVWENGDSSTAKDVSSLTNNASSRVANGQLSGAPSVPTAPLMSAGSPKVSALERKAAALVLNPISMAKKRPSLSQAQSRSDFFNLMRKKTSGNTSAILADASPAVLSPTVEKSGEPIKEVVSAPASPRVAENGTRIDSNDDSNEETPRFSDGGEKNVHLNGAVYPDEEEAAFLRSLGWEENAGEDEGLTEEEINAFYREYMKLRPSLKVCRGTQQEFSVLSESNASNSGGASSEFNSSDSETEA